MSRIQIEVTSKGEKYVIDSIDIIRVALANLREDFEDAQNNCPYARRIEQIEVDEREKRFIGNLIWMEEVMKELWKLADTPIQEKAAVSTPEKTKSPRQLTDVIDQMLKVIPPEKDRLIAILKDLHSSADFASPENQLMWWKETMAALNQEIGKPSAPWELEVQRIFTEP